MSPRICAIHQPNFFPWLGYFDKVRRADTFVFLDAVSYPRAGSGGMGSWVNRVKIAVQGEARWAGCPVRRASLGAPIREIEIDDGQPWREKLIRTLEANYARAANFAPAMALLTPLIAHAETNLAAFNMHAIEAIAAALGVSARFVRQSDLDVAGEATERLIAIARAVGADTYLAGGGAGGYQDDALFDRAGVTLVYQKFAPAPYGPPRRYIPGLSVIDYLMLDGRPLAGGEAETARA